MMKRKRGGILMLLLAVMLTAGCGKSDLDEDGVMQYLKQRYGGDFTRISTEQIPRAQRQYLDSRMEPVATRESDRNCDDIADVYEDADGLLSCLPLFPVRRCRLVGCDGRLLRAVAYGKAGTLHAADGLRLSVQI